MSKRRKWLIFLACLALAITLIALLMRSDEPRYEGRALSEWLSDLSPATKATASEKEEARAAIRDIGTNAIPYLLEYITFEPKPSRLRNTLHWALDRLPFLVKSRAGSENTWSRGRAAITNGVPEAFAALGDVAAPAIPRLETMVNDRNYPWLGSWNYWIAVWSLAAISTNVHPILLAELADPDPIRRSNAARAYAAYSFAQSNAESAVPLLIQALEGKDVDSRSGPILLPRLNAAAALGRINVPPALVLPALSNALHDPSIPLRISASNAIFRIAPEVLTDSPLK